MLPGVPEVDDAHLEWICDGRAAPFGRAGRSVAGELDPQPRPAGDADLLHRQPVLAREQEQGGGVSRPGR